MGVWLIRVRSYYTCTRPVTSRITATGSQCLCVSLRHMYVHLSWMRCSCWKHDFYRITHEYVTRRVMSHMTETGSQCLCMSLRHASMHLWWISYSCRRHESCCITHEYFTQRVMSHMTKTGSQCLCVSLRHMYVHLSWMSYSRSNIVLHMNVTWTRQTTCQITYDWDRQSVSVLVSASCICSDHAVLRNLFTRRLDMCLFCRI